MSRQDSDRPIAAQVGERIRELRGEQGKTGEQLAREADLAKGHLSRLERGQLNATVRTLDLLARCLDVAVMDLVNDPSATTRGRLLERTRRLSARALRTLDGLAEKLEEGFELDEAVEELRARPPKTSRSRRTRKSATRGRGKSAKG